MNIVYKWHICDLWSYDGSKVSWRAAIYFDKSQIVCQGKLSEIPQSTRCWHETYKVIKHDIRPRKRHKHTNIVCIVAYFVICGLMMGAKFSAEPQFVLTSLRLFVNENYLRSHRAPCADTKHEKSENTILGLETT